MKRVLDKARSSVTNAAKKFTNVSVARSKTAYPKAPKDLENLGLRWDYDGTVYNKFQVQPNAGKVPSTIREWREKNGGTHVVMGVMYVKKGGSSEDVATGFDNFTKELEGQGASFEGGVGGSGAETGNGGSSSSEWTWCILLIVQSHIGKTRKMNDTTNPFFNYTFNRWLYNEQLRLVERQLYFDINKLCRIIAKAVGQPQNDLVLVTKLAEGGSYRIFEATFRDGLKAVARLPYPCTIPRKYGVASEVATMEFLRTHGIPIPKILDWSSSTSNPLASEYIIMERVPGKELADTWLTMTLKERMAIIEKIVHLEKLLFDIKFPASGSIFFKDSLDAGVKTVDMPKSEENSLKDASRFCIGPSTEYLWWYQRRNELAANGGPWQNSEEVLKAVGEREILWLQRFGEKRYPREPFYREFYGREKVDPQVQVQFLQDYLKIAPHLVPKAEQLNTPIIRHPDLSPSNILISDNGDIAGVIDWQHAAILPLFLQAKVPKHFQNYGDDDSENFRRPKLADDFITMTSSDSEVEMELYRRRQVHYFYLSYTNQINKAHFQAIGKYGLVLRNQLFDTAGRPWEGDITSLQAQLIKTLMNWSEITSSDDNPPVLYPPVEIKECLDRDAKQKSIDEQMQSLRECIGVNIDGLVVNEEFENAREKAKLIKQELVEGADTEEEKMEFDEH
ncbi:phosphotransferase enzyme family protein [Sclerotinia borealis F-4128]|uniref:Phosphotransferase enzyme family protein n=1 Tax=Sclerotinia borealis (strain F-4128) TaxID=1432307 RepID=W9C7Q7_SCLBF|nr:phosphotransferase enzyme family protein [Sclerotinia borealis F-4128]